jgi:hypothetical protein
VRLAAKLLVVKFWCLGRATAAAIGVCPFSCRPRRLRGFSSSAMRTTIGVTAATTLLDSLACRNSSRMRADRSSPPRHNRLRPGAPAAWSSAGEIWQASFDPRGTLAGRYLKSRGLELPDSLAGRLVRFHAACPFGPGQRLPCMVTLFREVVTDRPVAIQRTALTQDGAKIGRMTMGPSAGAALKLSADTDVLGGLHIAEGFESALAAMLIGLRPIWALGSKGAIGAFPVLAGVESLTILPEPDAEDEVQACGRRWFEADREVFLGRPTRGKDLNDAIGPAA